jgi:branched-chain amino acid transport system substrate-binding protein
VFSNAQKVVSFGTSLSSSHLTKIGPYTFRNAATEDVMTPQSVRAAVAKLGVKRVAAIFQDDDNFAQGAYFAATPAIMKGKASLVSREPFTATKKDFPDRVARIKAAQPDVLYISSRTNDAAAIMLEAKKQGLSVPVIGNNNFVSSALYSEAKDAANNVIFTIPWSPDFDSARNIDFIARYDAKYKIKPNHFAALGYDALYVVAEALKKVTRGDLAAMRTGLRDALVDVKYEGATGKMKFVRNGSSGYNADKDVFTHIYKDGKFEYWKTGWFGQF